MSPLPLFLSRRSLARSLPRWSFPWKCACKICIPGAARSCRGIREKLSLNYELLKRLRARVVFHPPSSSPFIRYRLSDLSAPFPRQSGARLCIPVCRWKTGKREFPQENAGRRGGGNGYVLRPGIYDDGDAPYCNGIRAIFRILL